MSRKLDRQKALELRLKGKSYSQIKEALNVSKSTLSLWLKGYPLTKDQINSLRGKNPKRIEKFRETMRLKHESRLKTVYDKKMKTLLPLTNKELLVAGLFLYWGEGSKTTGNVSINNTDPDVLKFTLFWFCNVLKIPLSQFSKPYIKSSSRENLTHKGFGHGTCGIAVYKIRIKEQIMMSIKAISDHYSSKI